MKVKFSKAKSSTEAYKLACAEITEDYIDKFKVKADIHYNEEEAIIKATGKGFTLVLSFSETEAEVKLDLSFLLKPLKNKVLDTIEHKLKKTV